MSALAEAVARNLWSRLRLDQASLEDLTQTARLVLLQDEVFLRDDGRPSFQDATWRVLDELRRPHNKHFLSLSRRSRRKGGRIVFRAHLAPLPPHLGRENGEGLRALEERDEAQFCLDLVKKRLPRAGRVLELYFGADRDWKMRTLEEVGRLLGFSGQRAGYLLRQALHFLRRRLPRGR